MTTTLTSTQPRAAEENEDQLLVPLTPASVQSTALFKGQKTVVIEHNGTRYRLQSTKLGKLILTK